MEFDVNSYAPCFFNIRVYRIGDFSNGDGDNYHNHFMALFVIVRVFKEMQMS